jgi:hypothetical protein
LKGEGERQALDVLGQEDGTPTSDGTRLIEQHVDPQHAKAQLKFDRHLIVDLNSSFSDLSLV